MPTLLVRSMPAGAYRKVKTMARKENISLSQEVIRLVLFALSEKEKKEMEEKDRNNAFQQIRSLRKEIYAKYGKQEDSWKIIRRMRDERSNRL